RKLRDGEFDAIVLALAGVTRAGLYDTSLMTRVGDEILCAPSQGALAVQCRASDELTRALLSILEDSASRLCIEIERAVVEDLKGDCHSPIAARAEVSGENVA